jgi:hypothetical protein
MNTKAIQLIVAVAVEVVLGVIAANDFVAGRLDVSTLTATESPVDNSLHCWFSSRQVLCARGNV